MPELPEVEVVRKYLYNKINNKKIKSFKLISKKSLRNISEKSLVPKLSGKKIIDVKRIAKYLIIELSKSYIILHLRMEGKFLFVDSLKDININHTICIFQFSNLYMVFQDFRRFATIDYYEKDKNLKDLKIFEKIGPEPWDVDINKFYNSIISKKTSIKAALLSQKYISGLGNIYVDEVLFKCNIMPNRSCNKITKLEAKNIIKWSVHILRESIKMNGTTIKSFTHGDNEKGKYQSKLCIHNKTGEVCNKKYKVIKTKIAGRGTYYCSGGQK